MKRKGEKTHEEKVAILEDLNDGKKRDSAEWKAIIQDTSVGSFEKIDTASLESKSPTRADSPYRDLTPTRADLTSSPIRTFATKGTIF